MKHTYLLVIAIVFSLTTTGCIRHFAVSPSMQPLDFTVSESVGSLSVQPTSDARIDLEKKGKVESSCSGGTNGITHLGDKNYKNPLLAQIDNHLKISLSNSRLFSTVTKSVNTNDSSDYSLKCELSKFHVLLDEIKAQQVQACIGGVIGAMVASSIEVTATTEIELTAVLSYKGKEVFRYTAVRQLSKNDQYSHAQINAEKCMGEVIGFAGKDIATEIAKFLAK